MPTGHSPGRCSASYPLPFSTARTISITTAMPSTLSSKGATAASPPHSASRIRSSMQGAGSQPRYRRDRFRPPACRKGLLGFPKEMGVGHYLGRRHGLGSGHIRFGLLAYGSLSNKMHQVSGCLPRVDVVPADFRRGLPCCRYRFLAGCSLLQVARHELLQNERSPPWVPESTVRIHLLHVRR